MRVRSSPADLALTGARCRSPSTSTAANNTNPSCSWPATALSPRSNPQCLINQMRGCLDSFKMRRPLAQRWIDNASIRWSTPPHAGHGSAL